MTKISEQPPAGPLSGGEVVVGVQAGETVKMLIQEIANLAPNPGAPGNVGDGGDGTVGLMSLLGAGPPTVGPGITAVRTNGYTVQGRGAALYIYDASVNGAFVTANPRTSFLAADGRGFRLLPREVTPFMFGAIGDGVGDDAVPLQAFFDFCSAYDVGTADVTGAFSSSVGLVVGRLTTPLTAVFRGRFNLTLTGSGIYGLTFQSWDAGYWEYMQITGTGTTGSYASKTWMAAVLFDDSARNKIGYSRFSKFSFAGIIAGLNNNTLNNYGMIKASDCGSGARNGATWYGATGNWTAAVNSGSSGSTGQATTLTVDAQPPSFIGGAEPLGAIGDAQFMVRITDADGSTRLHHLKAVDPGAGTITVGPWVSNTATPAAFDYVYGGALYLRGNDSNVSTFEMIDALRCGVGLAATSLYSPTGQRVVTQFCGTGIMFGRYPGGAILGGKISGAYFEHNIEDIIMLSRSGGSVYNIVDSEYALNLGKCYCAGAPRLTDNSFSVTYANFNRLRLSYQGRTMQYEKQANNNNSNFSFEISRPDMVIPLASNGPTVTIASLDRDLHRLFGFDTARVVVVGTGTNGAPTGTVTFPVPTNPDAIWTLNGGSAPVTFSGFDGPAEFILRFDVPTLNCVVTQVRPLGLAIPTDKTANYTLVISDVNTSIGVNSATAKTLTVPPNSSVPWPIGRSCKVRQPGVGQVTLVAGAGVTLNSVGGALKISAQFGTATLTKVATDVWNVEGANLTT